MSTAKHPRLFRSIVRWEGCDPHTMSEMSRAAIEFAISDARHDILVLHERNKDILSLLQDAVELFGPHIASGDMDEWLQASRASIARAQGDGS